MGPYKYEQKLGNRKYSFETVIDSFVVNTKEKMLAVYKDSLQDLIQDAQTPEGAKGGKMRVDTGFLRASGVASLNSLPVGEDIGRKPLTGEIGVLPEYRIDEKESVKGTSMIEAIAKMKIGDVFYFGWTAKYAIYREAYDGFLESAVQKWQSIVDKNVKGFRK
jgi:hypothetical protein